MPTEVKKIPFHYIEWVISNYTENLIPIESLEKALYYIKYDKIYNVIEYWGCKVLSNISNFNN